MTNKTLYKYQKATMRPVERTYYDGFYLRDNYQVKLGKTILGNGPKDKTIALVRKLNGSGPKRTKVNMVYNHTLQEKEME